MRICQHHSDITLKQDGDICWKCYNSTRGEGAGGNGVGEQNFIDSVTAPTPTPIPTSMPTDVSNDTQLRI